MNNISVPIFDRILVKLEEWMKPLPPLNKSVARVLAKYAWAVVLVIAVMLTLSFITLLNLVLVLNGVMPDTNGAYIDNTLFASLTLLFMAGVIVLEYASVSPLKRMERYGWKLLGYAGILSFAFDAARILALKDISVAGALFMSLLSTAIFFYLLFGVKGEFK